MQLARPLARGLVALGVLAASAVVAPAPGAAALDVYTTPGTHNHNGRQWRTACSMYSTTVERCRTEIWGSTAVLKSGRYQHVVGWTFNNLTYKQSPRSGWARWNPLVTPGKHVVNGRSWSTECDTGWTGLGACRSMIWSTSVQYSNGKYTPVNKWVFNNIVNLKALPCPVSQPTLRKATGVTSAVIQGCVQSRTDPTWAAVDHSATNPASEIYQVTTFWKRGSDGVWRKQSHSGASASFVCHWFHQVRPPKDLAVAVPYCFRG